jgi:hypothetical protein
LDKTRTFINYSKEKVGEEIIGFKQTNKAEKVEISITSVIDGVIKVTNSV